MKCADFAQWIDRKLEGSLPGHELLELDDHLAGCRRCRDELMLQKGILEALTQEETQSGLSLDFTQRVSTRTQEIRREKVAPRWPAFVPVFALGAAILVVALIVADLAQIAPWKAIGSTFSTTFNLLGDALSGLLSKAPSLPSGAQAEPSPTAIIILASIVSVIPMVWSFRRMYAFLRD
jgi:anti-sigma factor RsiW